MPGAGAGSLFFLLLYAGDGGFACLRFDRVKAEVVENALYLRGVVREHHHFDAVSLLLVSNGNIQKAVELASVANSFMFSVGTLKNLNGRCSLSIRTSLVLPWIFF